MNASPARMIFFTGFPLLRCQAASPGMLPPEVPVAWTRKVVLQPVCQPDRHAWLQEIERTGSCGSKMSTSLALRGSCHWLSDFARRLTPLSALLISIGLVRMTVDHARDNFATSLGTILRRIRPCAKTLNLLRAPGTLRPPPLASTRSASSTTCSGLWQMPPIFL